MRNLSDTACNQNPITMPASSTVEEDCRKMRDHRIGAILVTDNGGALLASLRAVMQWAAYWRTEKALQEPALPR